jgi:hypothetical protein
MRLTRPVVKPSREGTLWRSAWVNRDFADAVILGLPATEWEASSWR